MPIEYEMMSKEKRQLYKAMWGRLDETFPVEKTIYKGKPSNNSYMFTDAYTNYEGEQIRHCCDRLCNLFNIYQKDLFHIKFEKSIGGSGHELKNIARLHSSSLCALLFFYGVSDENPYEINIDGLSYIFTYSCFEYQNIVIEGGNPSNIDIVLIGREKRSNEKVVLYLESKFSEYYDSRVRKFDIKKKYLYDEYGKKIYGGTCLSDLGIDVVEKDKETTFELCSKSKCYLEGIKQMISHYIGIAKSLKNRSSSVDKPDDNDIYYVEKAISEGAKCILGEILFNGNIGNLKEEDEIGCFEQYSDKYEKLSKILNKQIIDNGLEGRMVVLPKVLSYDFFKDASFIKEQRIKDFYFNMGE